MPEAQGRHRLQGLIPWLEARLPADRRFYVVIALLFGLVGYAAGVSLLGRVTRQPINLEEKALPPVQRGANPVLPTSPPAPDQTDITDKSEPSAESEPPVPELELEPAAVPDRSTFTEEQNCLIWKRTFPEAAAKLKPGDACY